MNILSNKDTFEKIRANPLPKRMVIDFSSLAYKTAFSIKDELIKTGFTDWRPFKYYLLDFILDMKAKIGKDSEVVIACDRKVNGEYWRANIFPGYKKKRLEQKSEIPKEFLRQAFQDTIQELEDNFPFKVVKVDGAEADDIVSLVCTEGNKCNVIITTDYDMFQLVNPNTFFFSLVKGFFMEGPSKKEFVFEKIIRGDSSDNIPNIHSDLDAIIEPTKRQRKMTNEKFMEYWDVYDKRGDVVFENYLKEDQRKRYYENKALMDLSLIRADIKEQVLNKYNECQPKGNANTAFKFCIANSMTGLLTKITSGGL